KCYPTTNLNRALPECPMRRLYFAVTYLALLLMGMPTFVQAAPAPQLLRVILIPADGGTEDGTKADYEPIFHAITKMTGINFEIRVGQSYSAVVEAMCSGAADVAFVGPVTYVQANQRHCADLLAVAVEKGQSIYYAGIFTKAASPVKTLKDLKGRAVAFGDVNSTSSFVFP